MWGRTFSETVKIEGDTLVVCVVLENTGDSDFYLTTGFGQQVQTIFGSVEGEYDSPDRSVFPGGPVASPYANEDRSFFVLETASSLTLCRNYRLGEFNFDVVRVQSRFRSWLMPGTFLAPIATKLVASGLFDRPLYSDEVLHSNTCDVDIKRRQVTCADE